MSAATAMHQPEAVIGTRGLTKVYRMGEVDVVALRGIDIEFFDGELAVLLGASGSGKSTRAAMADGRIRSVEPNATKSPAAEIQW